MKKVLFVKTENHVCAATKNNFKKEYWDENGNHRAIWSGGKDCEILHIKMCRESEKVPELNEIAQLMFKAGVEHGREKERTEILDRLENKIKSYEDENMWNYADELKEIIEMITANK